MKINLTPDQSRIVEHRDGPMLVVAGPGAGKTRVVVERIRRLLEDVEGHFRVLALTFTNKAANEMKERLADCQEVPVRVFIGTIHSFCLEVLENRGRSIGLSGEVNILETYQARLDVLAGAVRDSPDLQQLLSRAGSKKDQGATLGRWLGMIGEHKGRLVTPDLVSDPTERAIYSAYSSAMEVSSSVDFDDLLLLTYRIFEESPKVAAFYRRQYRFICVDEAQDINEAQYRLLCAMCGDSHKNVMLVGDPKQAIYGWNGADPKYLEMFKHDFGAEEVELSENFRSSKAVVHAAQVLNPDYSVEGELPIPGQLVLEACSSEAAEAAYVCDQIASLIESGHPDVEGNISYESCAVLGRNRYVFQELEDLLRDREIPCYRKLSSGAFHSESEVMQAYEVALRVVANPHDRVHIARLAKAWRIDSSPDEIRKTLVAESDSGEALVTGMCKLGRGETCPPVLAALRALSPSRDPIRFIDALDSIRTYGDRLDDDARALVQQDVKDWSRHWDRFVRTRRGEGLGVRLFLSQMALGTTEQARGDGVALITVHSAKGMEFDVVFIIGLCEGVFPDYRAKGEAMEEENRNAFVAVSRAKRLLYLSYPKMRMMPWGDQRAQSASKYFTALKAGGWSPRGQHSDA